MLQTDPMRPGWVQGWGVVKGVQPDWEFKGIYGTRAEADAAVATAGEGFEARWGGYNESTKEFVSGPQ
jgi:hypothetical protein